MKKILIIYPHWFPANLAGVHRPRLIGNYLTSFGWKPRVLTVKQSFFEENPDNDFEKTFSKDFDVTRVNAFKVTKPRIIGDIGLRAFFQLYKKAKEIIKTEKIDFIWIPIPSFYTAILGRLLFDKTEVPYGIDYIDPWVRSSTNQNGLRMFFSQFVATILEPIAIKKAAVISGVSSPYYSPALKRSFPSFFDKNDKLLLEITNPYTKTKMTHVGMPYGFDPNDHLIELDKIDYPWSSEHKTQKNWIYAGAFLPNSHKLLKTFFESIADLRKEGKWDETIRLWFVGTGNYPAKSIESYANDYGLNDIVDENRERYPFLKILNFLSKADTVIIIGSTEEHYTASKTFQALLSKKPIVSVFHKDSSAVKILEDCNAAKFTVRYNPESSKEKLKLAYKKMLQDKILNEVWNPDLTVLNKFSSKESANQLVKSIERVIG